jgi:hypothetical protein
MAQTLTQSGRIKSRLNSAMTGAFAIAAAPPEPLSLYMGPSAKIACGGCAIIPDFSIAGFAGDCCSRPASCSVQGAREAGVARAAAEPASIRSRPMTRWAHQERRRKSFPIRAVRPQIGTSSAASSGSKRIVEPRRSALSINAYRLLRRTTRFSGSSATRQYENAAMKE